MTTTTTTTTATRVCVFLGSSLGNKPVYREVAAETGRVAAERGLTVVYGGGMVGCMGVLANAALDAGGKVVGVIPQFMVDKEVALLYVFIPPLRRDSVHLTRCAGGVHSSTLSSQCTTAS